MKAHGQRERTIGVSTPLHPLNLFSPLYGRHPRSSWSQSARAPSARRRTPRRSTCAPKFSAFSPRRMIACRPSQNLRLDLTCASHRLCVVASCCTQTILLHGENPEGKVKPRLAFNAQRAGLFPNILTRSNVSRSIGECKSS